MQKVIGYFRLMRPANVVTAVADILAGIAISGYFNDPDDFKPLTGLILSTIGLYGGGVVFNDVFDAELDKFERPERPIPSGVVSRKEASLLGSFLLLAGIICAWTVSIFAGMLALITATAALLYDKYGKHHTYWGPLNMGACRGLNLLLGISIIPLQVIENWYLGFIPIMYIAAITMVSRGEVHGGKKHTLFGAAFLYALAMTSILYVSIRENNMALTLIFIGVWAIMVFVPLQNAFMHPQPKLIGKAVKAGVIALIVMNAAWASAFGEIYVAFTIILLLPLSLLLAKTFAVT